MTFVCICWFKSQKCDLVSSFESIAYGLDVRSIMVRRLAGPRDLCLPQKIETRTGSHPAPLSLITGIIYPGIKRQGREADHFHSIYCRGWEWVKIQLHSTSCLHGLLRDNFTFILPGWVVHSVVV